MSGGWRLHAEQLLQHAGRPALEGVRDPIDYRTLHARAESVVHALKDAGVAPGDTVALLSSARQFDEPIALAATLIAGASVVPLDAGSPPLRLDTIMADRGCAALVHDHAAQKIVTQLTTSCARVELDDDGFVLASMGDAPRDRPAPNPDVACVLHTSGSTGKPKAVPITWEGLDAFTAWTQTITGLTAGGRVLRVAELIFDLAWFDHLATWRAGATLVTMSRREMATAQSLRAAMATLRPSIVYGVPAMFMKLVVGLGDEQVHDELETLCFAGEVFPPAALAELARRAPNVRLFNLFGPTETNVCTFHEVRSDDLDGESELPIGIACPYAACQLVDDEGKVVEGVGAGELIVTGPTALGGTFATRDRVERRSDGLFYFRGRIDRMVKIRGYRVDPGEVEAALRGHEQVQEAAVVVAEHPRLGKTLRAHVTPRDAADPPEPRVLRAHLGARVAAYMVPERVTVHPDLPRTPTGKIAYSQLS